MATMADLNNIARPGVPPGSGGGGGGGGLPGIPPGMDKEAEKMWHELTRMAKEDPDKYLLRSKRQQCGCKTNASM